MRRAGGWIGRVTAWLVILGVFAVLAVAVVVPRVAGGTPYTVLTGSMRPSYPPGTLVVVKPVDADEIEVGDVITFQRKSGESAVVTHRVTAVAVGLDGKARFTTQGDDNQTPDKEPVEPVQVRGRLWYSIPFLGYVNAVLTGKQRQYAVYGVATLLVGYAAFMFVGAIRDQRRGRRRAGETVMAGIAMEAAPATRPSGPPAEYAPPSERRHRQSLPIGGAVGGAVLLVLLIRLTRHRRRRSDRSTG